MPRALTINWNSFLAIHPERCYAQSVKAEKLTEHRNVKLTVTEARALEAYVASMGPFADASKVIRRILCDTLAVGGFLPRGENIAVKTNSVEA